MSTCTGVYLSIPEEKDCESLEIFINGEDRDLDLHNNLTLVHCVFSRSLWNGLEMMYKMMA